MSDKSVCDEDLVSITFTAFNLLNFKKGMVHLHFYVDFFSKMINNVIFLYFTVLLSLIVTCGKELIEFF